jgi:site-specific DNA-methyltransferase (adenine-specific)
VVLGRRPAPPPTSESPASPWAVVAGYDDDGEGARWGGHPNHKPFGVLEPLLRTWTRPGQLVVDPFAGSGSIPAAALRLGRQVACLELSPEWAARTSSRLAQRSTEAAA